MEGNGDGPVFRANKRRKVFRRRADSDANDNEPQVASTAQGPKSSHIPSNGLDNATGAVDGDAASKSETARVRKPKKHGIAFSSADPTSSRPHNQNEETALVLPEAQSQEQQNGRFAPQTGKAIVEDDKHMSAYIDSRLAEMRSTATTPNPIIQSASHSQTPGAQNALQSQLVSPNPTERDSTPLSPTSNPPPNHPPTITSIRGNPNPSRRKGRNPRALSPSTTARATLIDQIMRESNHTPHYTSNPATKTLSSGPDGSYDPDAAAAAAFKADFLAQAEARNLSRRQPAVNASSSSSSAAAAVPSGPKLGGSRSARERMRAAEEAKGKK